MAITLPTDSQNPLLTTAEDATKAVPSIEEEQRRAFEGAVIGPERERQEAKREEIAAWSAKRVKKIDDALLNFDEFMPNKRPEVKRRFLVKKAIELHAGVEPDNIDLHRMARAQWGRKLFGQETETDEAFLAAMTKDAKKRKETRDFTTELANKARLSGILSGGQIQMEFSKMAKENPVYQEDPAAYVEMWKEIRQKMMDDFADVIPIVQKIVTAIDKDETSSLVNVLDVYSSDLGSMSEEEMSKAAQLLAFIDQQRGEAGSERGVGGNIGESFQRDSEGIGRKISQFLLDVMDSDAAVRSGGPDLDDTADRMADRDRVNGFLAEVRRFRDMRDPIKQLADEDSFLGTMERGLYAVPGVGSTIVASIGTGAVGSLGLLAESAHEDYYLEAIDAGVGRDEANQIAGTVAPVVGSLQLIPERIGLRGVTKKLPFLDKAMAKLSGVIRGKATRIAAGTVARASLETGTEEIQAILQEMGRDTLDWFNSEIPGADWDAHWSNFGSRNIETFLAIAPYSALGAFARDRGTEKAIARAREATRNQKIAAGFDPAAVDAFDKSKTPEEARSTFADMVASQDPNREATKEAAKKEAEITQRRAETAEQLRRYQASPGIRFDPEREGVEVYDTKTGETLANVANYEEASRVVYAIIEGEVDERSSVFQEINSILEAAQIDVEDSGKAVEVELRTFTESDLLNELPEAEARFGVQSELLEQRDGGTGEVTKEVMGEGGRRIRGLFIPAGNLGRRSDVTKLFGGSSVLTLIHERAHQKRRALMDSGSWSRNQQVSVIKALDSFLAQSTSGETFLPSDFDTISPEKQEVALDEAVSELAEVLALNTRNGQRSNLRSLISKNLRAMTKNRIPGAAQLAAFMRAMKEYFGIQLRRAAVLKTAVRQGKLNQGQIDKLTDMLIGKTDQESFNEESDAVPTKMVDGEPVDVPFSIRRAVEVAAESREGASKAEDEFFESFWPKILKKVGKSYKPSTRNIGRVVEQAVDDMRDWLNENPLFTDYYNADWDLSRAFLDRYFGGITEGEFSFFRFITGVTSPSTPLDGNVVDAVNAFDLWKKEGNFDSFEIASKIKDDGSEGNRYVKTGPFKFRANTGATKLFALKVYEQVLQKFSGDHTKAISYLTEAIPVSDLHKYKKQFFKGGVGSIGNVKSVVREATGQDKLIPRMFIFGPKVGAYTLNTLGNHNYTTTDIWEARFIRSYFPQMFEASTGLPVNRQEHEIFQRFASAFNEKLEKIAGKKLEPSAGQAARWFFMIFSAKKAGYRYARTDQTISEYLRRAIERHSGNEFARDVGGSGRASDAGGGGRNERVASFSLSPAQDAEYLKAVESGDMETEQEMVDEAAKQIGAVKLFHGSNSWEGSFINKNLFGKNTSAKSARKAFFLTDSIGTAESYARSFIPEYASFQETDETYGFISGWNSEFKKLPKKEQDRLIALEKKVNEEREHFDETNSKLKKIANSPSSILSDTKEGLNLANYRSLPYEKAIIKATIDLSDQLAAFGRQDLIEILKRNGPAELADYVSKNIVSNVRLLFQELYAQALGSHLIEKFSAGVPRIYEFFVLPGKFVEKDYEGRGIADLDMFGEPRDADMHSLIPDSSKDGIWFRNVADGGPTSNHLAVTNPNLIKSADPVTYDESGNVIPLSERFNESSDEISFDIGDGKVITGLLENVGRRGGKPEARAKIFADLARRFRELKRDVSRIKQAFGKDYEQAAIVDPRTMKSLRKERNFRQADKEKELTEQGESPKEAKTAAKAFADAWLEDAIAEQKRDNSQEAQIRRSLVLYDAILKALPPEIRGKLGGFVALSKLRTNEKRLEFLEKKIDQADEVIEKWLIKQQRKQIDKMFDSARPKKNAKGIIKARLNAEQTDQIADIESLALMPKQDLDEEIEKLEETIQNSTDQDAIDEATTELVRLMAFGNIDGKSSVELEEFFQNLSSIFYTGKMLKEFSDDQFRQLADGMKEIVNKDVTGGGGRLTSSEAKAKEKSRKLFRGLSKFHRKNLSFEWLMNQISRENKDAGTLDSDTHKAFSVEVHKATHREKRANLAIQKRYQDILSRVFGGVKGLALTKKISGLMEEQENTGVIKMDYDGNGAFTIKKARASNVRAVIEGKASLDSLEMTKEEFASAKAKFEELTKIAQDRENSRAAKAKRSPQKVSLNGNRLIEYESPNVGKPDNLTLSQSQAINLLMLYRQKDLKESMIKEGYSEETMKQMEAWLSPEGKQIRDWLTEEYDTNYDTINEVFKRNNGVSLPKTEFYSPARRIADGTVKDMEIDSSGNTAMSTAPNFLISRVKNFAEVDQTADALSLYIQHMVQTNHYVEWADTVKMLRTVFGDKTVKKNISDYAGSDLLSLISERIQWFADGGNRKATHISWMDKLRAAHTYSSLSYNWTVMIKQLTSLPAYAFDMGLGDFTKYAAKFMANPVKNLKEMMEEDYVKTRFKEGYERDVIDGLKREGGRFTRALKAGMILGKAGDIVPVMIGGWMAKKRSYDQAIADGMTKAQAEAKSIIDFEMATDRAQQAGDLKDLSSFQGGGSLFKLFTMYKTSPRQYYANVYESFLDAKAGKKGARKEFIRRLFIGHVILPLSFQFVSDLLKSPFDDEDDFEFENYLRAVLLGPLNGLFIMGDAAELIFSGLAGTKIWPEKVPILDGYELLSKGIDSLKDGDLGGAIDKLARGTGKITPGPVTFYDIIRKELRRFDVID